VIRKFQQAILVHSLYIGKPFYGNAVPQQFPIGHFLKEGPLDGLGVRYLYLPGNGDLLDSLPYLHQLSCAGLGVGLKLAAFGPVIGLVVMIDVAEQ
jgi:hypothetical protein